ncbi:Hsp90 chaperone hsp82 [Marasmius tenuissimus]|nr:Hsp90 chaperone hsp82 [Marasmius tenuissimus]
MDDYDSRGSPPKYLHFVRGIVSDSKPNLPLNVSHEILQHNKVFNVTYRNIGKKYMDLFSETAADKNDFNKFHESSGRLSSFPPRPLTSKHHSRAKLYYIIRMPKIQQSYMYNFTCESPTAYKDLPEVLKKKGFEVFSIRREGLDLEETEEETKACGQETTQHTELRTVVKAAPGDKVERYSSPAISST